MRHALNVTPLNGHNTLFGFGAAGQSMNAAGMPHLLVKPRPVQAAMSMTVAGAGTRAATGQGLAEMGLTAAGRCYLFVCGVARVALLVLDALADGRVIPVARGVAAMSMVAIARGQLAIRGIGEALGRLDVTAYPTIATRGIGLADQILTGSAGVPYPKMTPAVFAPCHPSRIVLADAADVQIMVPAIERTLFVAAEARTIHVPPARGN